MKFSLLGLCINNGAILGFSAIGKVSGRLYLHVMTPQHLVSNTRINFLCYRLIWRAGCMGGDGPLRRWKDKLIIENMRGLWSNPLHCQEQ